MDNIKLLRDQATFLAAFITVFGLVHTDMYYHQFGMKYQSLGLGVQHIIYRGASLLYFDPRFIFILISLSIVIVMAQMSFRIRVLSREVHSTVIIYLLFFLLSVAGIYLSFQAGVNVAVADMYPGTTSLRQLVDFQSDSEKKHKFVRELIEAEKAVVLIVDRGPSRLTVFLAPSEPARRPRVVTHQISVAANDYFSDKVPTVR